ncbi:unnamed protein product [Trichogramma brassicae]|uniref:Reverse transcriptase domain-containing protein n=1 Tax=Trichogramma brassicae TaxID=86971 RepID=A0A6H5IZZ2_9HYME|nr:unnamed protein product [Trichogramma brassicae]
MSVTPWRQAQQADSFRTTTIEFWDGRKESRRRAAAVETRSKPNVFTMAIAAAAAYGHVKLRSSVCTNSCFFEPAHSKCATQTFCFANKIRLPRRFAPLLREPPPARTYITCREATRRRQAEHGYASTMPIPDDIRTVTKRPKTKKSQGSRTRACTHIALLRCCEAYTLATRKFSTMHKRWRCRRRSMGSAYASQYTIVALDAQWRALLRCVYVTSCCRIKRPPQYVCKRMNVHELRAILESSAAQRGRLYRSRRPIAKLCELSKLCERVVYDQVISFLDVNCLLNPRQSGFRRGHSTQTALLGVMDDARRAIERSQITVLVLIDFSKAFDTVPHQLLLAKLRRFNFADRTIRWFASYLRGRTQAVAQNDGVDGRTSSWLPTTSGVPQGSVLGPLLFSLFVNDLPTKLRFSKHMMFADDLQVYHSFPLYAFNQAISRINRDLSAVSEWAQANGLSLNAIKTKAILIGSDPFLRRVDLRLAPKITLDNTQIEYSTEVKCLGVWIQAKLDWSKQVDTIVARVFGALRSLRHYRHALTMQNRKDLVQSLIFPHFDYACAVYHDLFNDENLKLQRALNATNTLHS